MNDGDALRGRVSLMRELGVLQWDGITLGPVPLPPATEPRPLAPPTEEEQLAAIKAQMRERFETLYAASGNGVSEQELDRLARIELAGRR